MSDILQACVRIRQTVSMSALAGQTIELKKSGKEWKGCCPFHPDSTPSFTIYADDRRWHCFGQCGDGDQLDFVMRVNRVNLVEAIRMIDAGALPIRPPIASSPGREKEDRTDEARDIWRKAGGAAGTCAEGYLRGRGIHGVIPETIRFTWLPYGGRGPLYPCLIALVVGPDNRFSGIQRTFLAQDSNRKANVPKPKLSLGRLRGGAIRLAPAADEIVVCEGLEDGLTLQQELGLPTWVAAGAGNLATMRLPLQVRSVVIGADNDLTGLLQAENAAKTFSKEGRRVRIMRPSRAFKDFNDELRGIAIPTPAEPKEAA